MIIAVDFDGTVVDHRYPDVGPDAPGAVDVLSRLAADGHHLILWTMRSEESLIDAKKWFDDRGIPLWGVLDNPQQHEWTSSRKVYAQLYIDDAAFGAPLTNISGFKRPVIDWSAVANALITENVEA